MVILGGVITALIVTSIYVQRKKLAVLKIVDVVSPSLALGIAIGRIGCFLNGCCFGKACHLPWAISFPPGSIAHYIVGNQAVHPSQLYESFYSLLIFFTILFLEKRKKFFGFNGALFLTMYGIFRFINEMFRYYEGNEKGMVLFSLGNTDLTFSQIISLLMVVSGILVIILGNRSAKFAQE
jgi:phosphatidylglycerol:prolipoprotein diacylglycerol transferase